MSLLSSLAKPLHRLIGALKNAIAVLVSDAEIELCVCYLRVRRVHRLRFLKIVLCVSDFSFLLKGSSPLDVC